MANLEVRSYGASGGESAIVYANHYAVVLERHKENFMVALESDVSLSEAWANMAPALSAPDLKVGAIVHHNIPGISDKLTLQEAVDQIPELSREHKKLDFLRFYMENHLFSWYERKADTYLGGAPEIAIAFKKFEPQTIRKLLGLGRMTICRASQDIMEVATPLFEHYI